MNSTTLQTLRLNIYYCCTALILSLLPILCIRHVSAQVKRPNILFIISDDQGYPGASAYGSTFVQTPTFDKIAREGLLFENFFVTAPHCSPSRASILTGQHIWQNGPVGTHWSGFPANLVTYTDLLRDHGYRVGYTGKGWAPGNWIDGGRKSNPAGIKYMDLKDENKYVAKIPTTGISHENYAGSFEMFLNETDSSKPFCFWMGGWEPHLPYEEGSGLKYGGKLNMVKIPSYLPSIDTVRSDLLDYALEIEWFDKQAGKAIQMLKEMGLLNNTLIVFTSDNGMPFPRAKAFSFDMGNHVPFAMMWKGHIVNPGRKIGDLTSAIDLFPTFLDIAGLDNVIPKNLQGKSLSKFFNDKKLRTADKVKYIYWGRERHGSARWDDLGYPQRAVRSERYLLIWNLKPERYPAGSPKEIKNHKLVWSYGDIGPTPTKKYMINHEDSLFRLTFRKFSKYMLYDIKSDPNCMVNLFNEPKYQGIKDSLLGILRKELMSTNDPRMGNDPDIWESYRRYGPIHTFLKPSWAKKTLKNSIIKN